MGDFCNIRSLLMGVCIVDFCNNRPLFLGVCMVDFCNIRPHLMGVCMGDFCNISLLLFYILIYIWLTLFISKLYIFPLISLKEKTREDACEWNKWEFSCDISTFISLMVRQNIFQVSDTSSAGLSLRLWLFLAHLAFRPCELLSSLRPSSVRQHVTL